MMIQSGLRQKMSDSLSKSVFILQFRKREDKISLHVLDFCDYLFSGTECDLFYQGRDQKCRNGNPIMVKI